MNTAGHPGVYQAMSHSVIFLIGQHGYAHERVRARVDAFYPIAHFLRPEILPFIGEPKSQNKNNKNQSIYSKKNLN